MTQYRITSLFTLLPGVEFSFSHCGKVFTLISRSHSGRSNRCTLTLKKKGSRKTFRRHIDYEKLWKTYVYLKGPLEGCPQPKSTVCLTISNY